MRKSIIVGLLFINFILISHFPNNVYAMKNKPVQHSTEELYQDIFCSLLMPYIDKTIDKYYTKHLTDLPTVDPWDINILSVERPSGYRTFSFVIKIQVIPYVGPHLGVGIDRITLTVSGTGVVDVISFSHIKDYRLPPNYQSIVKKKN